MLGYSLRKGSPLKTLNLKLFIAGVGEEYENLLSQVKELGLENDVVFLQSFDKNIDLWPVLDIYVQASDEESFGMAAAEALCIGIPTLVSNGGALPEVIGKDGFVFRKGEVDDLVKKLEFFIENLSNLKNQFQQSKEEYRNKYSVEIMVKNYNRFYNSL